MKTRLFSLLVVLAAPAAFAQPDLSPRTRMFLDRYQRSAERQPGTLYRTDAAGNTVLPALLLMQAGASGADLDALGVRIGTRAGAVWTASIPPDRLAQVATLSSVRYLELDEPLVPTMDSARVTTRVDSVHAGIALPQAFSGAGVVVGVLDVGFDYTHPAFYDTSGTRYRIRRVWEQKTTGATPPPGYSYGRELTDTVLMKAAGTDNAGQSHGTHVAGIAGGSGQGAGDTTRRRYRGMAYASDLVLVGITPAQNAWTSTSMGDIIDGMKYVYDYAASVGKPAVVNLSWGCPVGPHDGRSLFSQACDALTGPGRLFVLSAGNNGTNTLHAQKTLSATDTALHTFFTFPTTPIGKRSWIDAWGDSSQNLSVRLSLYNGVNKTDSTAWLPLGTLLQNVVLKGATGDSLLATVSASVAAFNNKPRILLELDSRTVDRLCVSVRGSAGTVHLWSGYVYQSSGYYGSLTNGGFSWATAGNSNYTVSDMVTTRSALGVGAYTSKNVFYNIANTKQDYSGYAIRGRLAPFSSKGPAADGRIKPDIAGPGLHLTSAINSFDASYAAAGTNREDVVTEWTAPTSGRTYQYASLMGTSMSSPAVAGITALLLEATPTLTPDSLRSLLAQTAIQESHMGTLPNASWGAGKVNAYRALQRVLGLLGISEVVSNRSSLDVLLYPNPASGTATLECAATRSGMATATVSDALGRVVQTERWSLQPGSNAKTLNWSRLPAGLYLINLSTPDGEALLKATVQ